MPAHTFCIAPMMDWTDRHERYFLRLLSRHALLYTEMITSAALTRGDASRLLAHDPVEYPLAVQLGGSDPEELAAAAKLAERAGYGEVNLNIGCPSDRVQSGRFGACLMAEPALVADCVAAIAREVEVPVTVKCRIGIDEMDSDESLANFISQVAAAGCRAAACPGTAREASAQARAAEKRRVIGKSFSVGRKPAAGAAGAPGFAVFLCRVGGWLSPAGRRAGRPAGSRVRGRSPPVWRSGSPWPCQS